MFTCILCNYSSEDKSNYNKHCKSVSHLSNEIKNKECILCNKKFISIQTYKQHKKNIHNKILEIDNLKKNIVSINKTKIKTNKNDIITEIKNSENKIIESNKEIKDEIKEEINEVKTVVSKAITKASSLIKYLMEHHSSVPPIRKITDKECIKTLRINYNCLSKKDTTNYELEKLLIHENSNGDIIETLSKCILEIVNYNKPNLQPIYNTDATRYNYVIKTNEKWNEDLAGIKFSDYIIKPLLENIGKLIETYRQEKLETVDPRKNSFVENERHINHLHETIKFECDILHGKLINPILRKLSPYLRYLQSEIEQFEKYTEIQTFQKELENLISNSNDNELDYDTQIKEISDNNK